MSAARASSRPLRVVHVIESLGLGGAENLLADALPALAARDVHVRVRALHGPDLVGARMRSAGLDVGLLTPDEARSGRSLARALLDLRAELARDPADVVHSHLFDATLVARASAVSFLPRPRVVTSLHSPHLRSLGYGRSWSRSAREVVDFASALATNDAIVAVSAAVARDYERYVPRVGPWGRIEVVHNVIDVEAHVIRSDGLDRAASRAALGVADSTFLVLSIGRLSSEKNYVMLIDAIQRLRARGIDAVGLVLGDGPDRARLAAAGAGLVRFEGSVPRESVARALVACDVYVQPSRFEAFGMAILEAMASARPVVATRVDGIPEVVEEGVTGHLVRAADAAALADELAQLHASTSRRAELGAAGRARARSLFGVDRWAERTRDLYARLAPAQ